MTYQEAKEFISKDENYCVLHKNIILKRFLPSKAGKYTPVIYIPKLDKYFHIKVNNGEMTVDYSNEITYR